MFAKEWIRFGFEDTDKVWSQCVLALFEALFPISEECAQVGLGGGEGGGGAWE